MTTNLKLFSGRSNPRLSQAISEYLGMGLGRVTITPFPDGEIMVKLDEDVRGRDVFIIQPTCTPVNESLMELLIFIDCARRASAERITAVIPYFGYARQDRKDEGRVPITAKLAANLIATAGADRVLTIDLHAAQIQGFFDIPVDNLYAEPVLSRYYTQQHFENLVLVSPDVGNVKRARVYAQRLGGELAIIDKRRMSGAHVEVGRIIGDVKDRTVLMMDDMISTAGHRMHGRPALHGQGRQGGVRRRDARGAGRSGGRAAAGGPDRADPGHRHDPGGRGKSPCDRQAGGPERGRADRRGDPPHSQ